MPRPHTTMRQIRNVLRLHFAEKLSVRDAASSLAMARSTVNDYLIRARVAGLSWPLPEEVDDDQLERRLFPEVAKVSSNYPQPDFETMKKELAKKGVTLQLLWFEYREIHPDGYGYSQFCQRYRDWRRKRDVVMRQDHKAGEKLFVDFPGLRIPIYDEATLQVSFHAELFVAVLGASSYLYAEALRSQELEYWVGAHVHAFEFLGGVPAILVSDNLRSAVTKAHRYEPDLNATYQELASHYGTAIIPARPYKPRDKAKVEAGVLLAERWIIAVLRHRRFTSLAQLNELIASLVTRLNDKPFKKLEGSRASLFSELDAPALRPLPAQRYEFATWRLAKVNIDYHVEVDHHYYSVPYQLAGQVVEVRLSASVVEVFAKHQRVASHLRSYLKGRHVTESAHMPDSHRRYLEWTPGRIVAWAQKNGPSTAAFIEGLLASRPHPEQGFRSALGVMRLVKKYSPERLEAACERALVLKSFSYKSIESMLTHGLDQRPLRTASSRSYVAHRNIRGPNYYQ
ncbi:MAG TPA: IS21 family transposase [Acidimicrobiales bacterium]|nr:IS21 family transposase [Acidimicrobiales bacterium]